MTDREKWAHVPFEIRLFENSLAALASLGMVAGILFWPALLVGVPLMIRGLVLESKFNGFPVDVDRYIRRGVQ